MLDISREFNKQVLDKGKQYYKMDRVKNLTKQRYGYQAEVIDSIVFQVKVLCGGNDIVDMSCNCPEGMVGTRCRHQAAVLYALDKIPEETLQEDKDFVKPFATMEAMHQDYAYFDMAWMTRDIDFTEKVCKKAHKLLKSKSIILESVDFGYRYAEKNSQLVGRVHGYRQDKGHMKDIFITFNRDHIENAQCDIDRCYHSYNHWYSYGGNSLCEHQVALLYLLAAHLVEHNPGDATDYTGSVILGDFQKQHAMQVMSNAVGEQKNIRLEPRLEKTNGGLRIGFRIGNGKLFVVKNMTELVQKVEDGKEMYLGSTSSLDFSQQSFEEKSLPFYEYIETAVKEEEYRKNRDMEDNLYYDSRMYEVKNNIHLQGKYLDEFFDLAQNMELEYTDKTQRDNKKTRITLVDKKPSLDLQIEKVAPEGRKDKFDGVGVNGTVSEITEGVKSVYFIEDNQLCRAKKEEIRDIMPLLQSSQDGEISFTIGRRKLPQFYYSLLPVLKKYGTVREVDAQEIENYLPPEVAFRFYLDIENGEIICQPKAIYGEQEESPVDDMLPDAVYKSWRDRNKESEINYHLNRIFPKVDFERKVFHTGDDEDVIYDVMEQGVSQLFSLGEVHSTEQFRNMNVRKKPKVTVGVSVESDIMNLSVISDDISLEELLEALNSYRRKKKYHRLKNGDFMSVDEENMEALAQMMDTLHITPKEFVKGKMQIPTYRALYLDKMLEQSESIYAKRDSHFKKLLKEFKTVNDSEYEVPESLQPIMRNYQIIGYKWLRTLASCGFGGILADDMGLGKTLQMIAVLLAAKNEAETLEKSTTGEERQVEDTKGNTSLIVAPASLVYNWYEECKRFAPELKVNLIVGTQKERAEKIKDYKNWDVLVTSYDLLKRDILEYEVCCFLYQVLDEAQYIKNHATAAAKAVKVIKSKIRYALTGTPIENRLSELWSIFDYLMPGFLYKYEVFKRELENPVVKNKDEKVTERLKKMVSPFILRRVKKDVLKDLPEKLEEVRYAKLENQQRKLYDGQVAHMKQMLAQQPESDFQKNKMKVLAELMRIRQICCDPSLLWEDYDGASAKREACMELVKSAVEGEHKVLIFSQFTSMLELLEKDLNESNIAYYKITGETPKKTRVELVQEYNTNDVPVFLISLKAGGTGLNLTGADVVIHYDPWWNLAVQNQATDRAHRIGQTKVVVVYKLIAKDSIEEKIVQMQETKKNLADEILSGEMGGLSGLNKEELLELIG